MAMDGLIIAILMMKVGVDIGLGLRWCSNLGIGSIKNNIGNDLVF